MSARDQSELELQALQRVVASGRRALDLDVVLDRCLEQTIAVSRAAAGAIYLADERRGYYRAALRRGVDAPIAPDTVPIAPFDEKLPDHSILDLRTSGGHPARRFAIAEGYTHCLLVILRVDDRRVGFVALPFDCEPVLAESTRHTIDAIAAFEAVAIESARMHRKVELRARLAQLLVDCGEQLLDPAADAPSLILGTACKMVDGDRGLLSRMWDKDGVPWSRIVHAIGADVPLVGMSLPSTAPYLRESLELPAPLVVEDTDTLDPASVIGRVAREQGTRSFVLVTMRQRGRPIGQLFVATARGRAYAEEEVEALQLLSSLGAQALARAEREAAERAQHARVADILEHLPIVIFVIDRSGKAVHMNAAAREFVRRVGDDEAFGFEESMRRLKISDHDGNAIAPQETGFMRAFAGETTARAVTIENRRGTRLHVLSVTVPLRAADGTIDAVLSSFQDVTELRDLADAKDRFLSIASHELRSPITSLRATTSLLQLDPNALTDESRRAVLVGRIQRQIDRLSLLVERLLDTTRLNAGELPLDLAECDLVALCQEAVDHARLTDREHEYFVTAPPSIAGRWDAARLEQVLTNLLSNASRYSPPQTRIDVRAWVDGDRALVDVADQGPGIAPDQQDMLFTPFYRGTAASRHKGGLGLGLYITREIVRRHGGTMRVSSVPGHGATFTVELPRKS